MVLRLNTTMLEGRAPAAILLGFVILILTSAIVVLSIRYGMSMTKSRSQATAAVAAAAVIVDTTVLSLDVALRGTTSSIDSFITTALSTATASSPSGSVYKARIKIDLEST